MAPDTEKRCHSTGHNRELDTDERLAKSPFITIPSYTDVFFENLWSLNLECHHRTGEANLHITWYSRGPSESSYKVKPFASETLPLTGGWLFRVQHIV